MDQFARSALLIGQAGVDRLRRARVALFGVGGVGGYAAEALARSGVGELALIDPDTVSLTNLNRQIIALHSTLGRPKAEAMAERLRDINPEIRVTVHPLFYLPDTADAIDLSRYDYIADAIDTVSAKLELARRAWEMRVPILSAMGAGNRLDPSLLRVGDIFETQNCPLARVMRRELRRRGVPALRVVYSAEPAITPCAAEKSAMLSQAPSALRRDTPGSMAFVPAAMGLLMASVIVRDLAVGTPEKEGEGGC